jgi:hypothetical protein
LCLARRKKKKDNNMGSQVAKQRIVEAEEKRLREKEEEEGIDFPGSDYRHHNHKEWMATLPLESIKVRDVLWPGTHDSATDKIGVPFISRPFARCQKLSIYQQLCRGARVLDIRVQQERKVCHGPLTTYKVDVVVADIRKFLDEMPFEFIILQLRTGGEWEDPPGFDAWLIANLGEYLVAQDEGVLEMNLLQLLPRRVICIWNPKEISYHPQPGSLLWSSWYLQDDWIDTDLPLTKFDSNLVTLGKQAANEKRGFFYRVENTTTPQVSSPVCCVFPVTNRIRGYARFFISQAFKKGIADRLQIFVEDFLQEDFVDACIGVTLARYYHPLLLHEPELLQEVLSRHQELVAATSRRRCKQPNSSVL